MSRHLSFVKEINSRANSRSLSNHCCPTN